MPEENKKVIKLDYNEVNNKNSIKKNYAEDKALSSKGLTLPAYIKFLFSLLLSSTAAVILGKSLGYIFKNPLSIIDFNLNNFILLSVGLVSFITFILLIAIFFNQNYFLLSLTSILSAVIMSISTLLFNNVVLMVGFGFGIFLVLLLFFVTLEGDISNQFTFRFFQALRSTGIFTTSFAVCVCACLALSLISVIGSTDFKVPDDLNQKVVGFVSDKVGSNLDSNSKSIDDQEKNGVNISIFKSLDPSATELLQTPEEFISSKVNDFFKSNSVIITIGFTLFTFFGFSIIYGNYYDSLKVCLLRYIWNLKNVRFLYY